MSPLKQSKHSVVSPNNWDVDHLERLGLYDSKNCTWIMQWGIHKAKNLLVGVGEIGQDLPDEQQKGGGPAVQYACHHLRYNTHWKLPHRMTLAREGMQHVTLYTVFIIRRLRTLRKLCFAS